MKAIRKAITEFGGGTVRCSQKTFKDNLSQSVTKGNVVHSGGEGDKLNRFPPRVNMDSNCC